MLLFFRRSTVYPKYRYKRSSSQNRGKRTLHTWESRFGTGSCFAKTWNILFASTDNTRHYILDSTKVTPWDTSGYPFMLHPYIPDSKRETYTDPLFIFRENWAKNIPDDNIFFTRKSEKEKSIDRPSWAKGLRPTSGESVKEFAKKIMNELYGKGNYDRDPRSDYNKLKKWGDRGGKNK